MDKSNIAFALITSILGLYIAVALVLARLANRRTRLRNKPNRSTHKPTGSGPWTSFSS